MPAVPKILTQALDAERPIKPQLEMRREALFAHYELPISANQERLLDAMLRRHHGNALVFGSADPDPRQTVKNVDRLRALIDALESNREVSEPDADLARKIAARLKYEGKPHRKIHICRALEQEKGHLWSGIPAETLRANYRGRKPSRHKRDPRTWDHRDIVAALKDVLKENRADVKRKR